MEEEKMSVVLQTNPVEDIMQKYDALKQAVEDYLGALHVGIDVKVHSGVNCLNRDKMTERFVSLGDVTVEFDKKKESAWLKKEATFGGDFAFWFTDYAEAVALGYLPPIEEAEG